MIYLVNKSTCFSLKEDFDPDDDEDEGLPLYVLAEQLFIKEENRRQRLAQTMIRNDFHSVLNGNITSQQRSLSRHSRGDLRGKFE
jgi:hypothetical protein